MNEIMTDCLKVLDLARDVGVDSADMSIVIESISNAIYRVRERGK